MREGRDDGAEVLLGDSSLDSEGAAVVRVLERVAPKRDRLRVG